MAPRIPIRVITIVTAALLLALQAFGQARGGGGTAPPANTGTGAGAGAGAGSVNSSGTGSLPGSTLPGNTNTTGSSTSNSTAPKYRAPIFLSGQVKLDDGGPLPEPATIERICGGNPRAEGYTDSRGYFAIELGNESGVFQDASESYSRSSLPGGGMASGTTGGTMAGNGAATMDRYGTCDLRARLTGYRSQSVSLANRRSMDDPNIGVILLHREGADAGTTVSNTTLQAPKDARKDYDRGMQSLKKDKVDDAEKAFQKAVEEYPAFAAAWYEMGKIHLAKGRTLEARGSFQEAIRNDTKFVSPYVQLSLMALHDKKWPELNDLTARATKLDNFDYPQLFLLNGVACYNMHRFDAAEKSVQQAARLDTQHQYPDIERLTGLILLLRQDYPAAAEQFRSYLKRAPDAEEAAEVRTQLTKIDTLTAQSSAKQDR
jgi:tetratricopeptide (TPR) repeat protein